MKRIFFNLLIFSFLWFSINACKDDPSPEKKVIPDSCAVVIETVKDKLGMITYNPYNNKKEWVIGLMETFPSCHWAYLQICGELPDSLKLLKDKMLKIDGEKRASKVGINGQNFKLSQVRIDEDYHPKNLTYIDMSASNSAKLTKPIYLITSQEAYVSFMAETGYSTPQPIDFDKFALIGFEIRYGGCCEPIRNIVKEYPNNNHIAVELVITDESFCRLLTIVEGWFIIPKYNSKTTFSLEVKENIIK
jgi:hypothetical protein